MADKKLREPEPQSHHDSIAEGASDWLRQFVKHFELNFFDSSGSLPPEAGLSDYWDLTIRTAVRTLLDSGMTIEEIEEGLGRALVERRSGPTAWNSDLNRRRFELIDKEIQDALTLAEKIELAGLTRIMRENVETEANLPFEGAKALHRQLLERDITDKPP